jgi:hypothetical protein
MNGFTRHCSGRPKSSGLHNLLFRGSECPIKMVLETLLATTHPLANNPIRHRERSAMLDYSTIPADAETMSKPDCNAGERTSTVWSRSMQIWHDKVTVGTKATDFLSPCTVTLRSMVDIGFQIPDHCINLRKKSDGRF